MANNILSSLLGGDEAVAVDGVEAETLVSGDAFASALAADHAKYDPVPPRPPPTFCGINRAC